MNLIIELNKFLSTLVNQGFKDTTIKGYKRSILLLINWLEENLIIISAVNTDTVVRYMNFLNAKGKSPITTNQQLKALDEWFTFLAKKKIVKLNPFFNERVDGKHKTIVKNTLSKERLQEIFNAIPSEGLMNIRNKSFLSLIFFQGMAIDHIQHLQVSDINLEEDTISIPKTKTSNARVLELHKTQRKLFSEYLNSTRPLLLRLEKRNYTQQLFFNKNKKGDLKNLVSYLLTKLRKQFPDLIDMKQVRASVITHWVEESTNILEAKEKSGLKYLSSVEAYDDRKLEELKAKLDKVIFIEFKP